MPPFARQPLLCIALVAATFRLTIAMTKPASVAERHQWHLQPEAQLPKNSDPRIVSFAEVADRAIDSLSATIKAPTASTQLLVYILLGSLVPVVLILGCVSLSGNVNSSGIVATAMAAMFSAGKPSHRTAPGGAPQFKATPKPTQATAPGKPRSREQEEATHYRQWQDPRKSVVKEAEDASKRVHFLTTPTFETPPGVLTNKETAMQGGGPAPRSQPFAAPAPTPQYCEPQLSKSKGKNAILLQQGVAPLRGA